MAILLESGDALLVESGSELLLESDTAPPSEELEPVGPPQHLVGAIRAFLLRDAAIMAQLTGGIADGQAPRDAASPYLVLESQDVETLRVFGNAEVQFVRVEFSVWATGRAIAESIGNAVRDAVLPPAGADPWVPLALLGGWSERNRQPAGGDSIAIDPETRAAYGKDVWACRRTIIWTIARG